MGCQTVEVRAPEGATVVLGDEEKLVTERSVKIDVGPGFAAVPYAVTDSEGKTVEGEVDRSELSLWWALAAFGITACTLPTCLACAVAVANPGLFVAPFFALSTVSLAPLTAIISAPSWFTLPLVGAGTAVGLQPMWFLGFSEQLPDEVNLSGRRDDLPDSIYDTRQDGSEPHVQEVRF